MLAAGASKSAGTAGGDTLAGRREPSIVRGATTKGTGPQATTLRVAARRRVVRSEQLCLESSSLWVFGLVPGGAVAHHRVQNGQQLAHARHDRNLRRLALGNQALMELADHAVVRHG